jgi:hypothetical protein
MWMRRVNRMREPDGKRGVRPEGPGVAARCFPLSTGACGSGARIVGIHRNWAEMGILCLGSTLHILGKFWGK